MQILQYYNQLEIESSWINVLVILHLVFLHLHKPTGLKLEVIQLRTCSPFNIVRRQSAPLTTTSLIHYKTVKNTIIFVPDIQTTITLSSNINIFQCGVMPLPDGLGGGIRVKCCCCYLVCGGGGEEEDEDEEETKYTKC